MGQQIWSRAPDHAFAGDHILDKGCIVALWALIFFGCLFLFTCRLQESLDNVFRWFSSVSVDAVDAHQRVEISEKELRVVFIYLSLDLVTGSSLSTETLTSVLLAMCADSILV